MSKEKNNKNKQKEQKLSAVERRRLQRERERNNSGEESRFSAFETIPSKNKRERLSPTDQRRFSAFDVNAEEEKDDYFDRMYGSISADGKEERNQRTDRKKSDREQKRKSEKDDYADKNFKVKELTKKQRKTRINLSYFLVFTVVVVLAVVMSLTVMFKTTEIIVNGENIPYSKEEIISASGLSYSENIFLAKRKAAVKNIVDNYPYIEAAEVTFRIPGTQIITLEAAVPSYQVAVTEGFAIVSAKARVLEITNVQRANIPLLKGLKLTDIGEGQYINFEKNTTQQILNEVINNINENEVPNIYGIDISNSASIKLNYDNRITILLGVPEDVGYKLRTAMSIINNELSATDKGDLDVSLASSDRKSSYFTPIYSNTVDIDDSSSKPGKSTSSKPESTSRISSQASDSGSATIKSADEYFNGTASKTTSQEENYDVDVNDILDDDYEYSDDETPFEYEQRTPNIISDYGDGQRPQEIR